MLFFFGSAGNERNARALSFFDTEMRHYFDDEKIAFFGVSTDPDDKARDSVRPMQCGVRFFWDFDGAVSTLYGALDAQQSPQDAANYRPFTLILDPSMRTIGYIEYQDEQRHNALVRQVLASLPAVDAHAQIPLTAPVLVVPRVFEPDLCRHLIALYENSGGKESGAMVEKDGYTVAKIDYAFKRRMDYEIEDESVRKHMRARIIRRLLPEIAKAFQFNATYIERYLVACYSAEVGGFFNPHRDNTTKGTAHRRFACTINLNAEEYEGGNLRFPEFGTRQYRAPTGGAVVFSCSLLHEALPVTKGKRYATLPFLYDEAAAKIREENLKYLSEEVIDLNAQRSGTQG